MASKFYAGMKNVVEALNEMWAAFAAGPYNALPLSGGTMTGPLTSLVDLTVAAADFNARTVLIPPPLLAGNVAGTINPALRLGVVGQSQQTYSGRFTLATSFVAGGGGGKESYILHFRASDDSSSVTTSDLLRLHGDGRVYMPVLKAGSTDPTRGYHQINRGATEGDAILLMGVDGLAPSVTVFAGTGSGFETPLAVMHVAKNNVTGRSSTNKGTVNAMGNDYAEYFFKCLRCGLIKRGQIVGITADNEITDCWADAVMFAIKSTDPSYVGGDTWAAGIGPRPSPQAGLAPTSPVRRADAVERKPLPGAEPHEYVDVVTPGDTDAEWAAKQAAYAAALSAHAATVQQDAESMATFDAALEIERQKVDRIAIAGRVPVNVLGAQPGDYIVPVQDGEGIAGIAVHADDITMPQYLRAVGRVISIEPDGRAYVMVKAV